MRSIIAASVASVALTLAAPPLWAEEPKDEPVASEVPIAELLRDVPLIDGHNDLIIHYINFKTGEFKKC